MELKTNIEMINSILGNLPEFLYHGRIGDDNSINNDNFDITIYSNEAQTKYRKFWELKGRINLDFAFHGFYLTPCEAMARKWAFAKIPKENEYYQILKYKINYDVLNSLKSNILVVPDSNWSEYIFRNRAKIYKENEFDFVFGFIADGIMANIYGKIDNNPYDNPKYFHCDIMKDRHKRFLEDYYGERQFTRREIIQTCGLNEYCNYQLCISSDKALKMLDLVDIIRIDKNIEIPDNLEIDTHLSDYKILVPDKLINSVIERSE